MGTASVFMRKYFDLSATEIAGTDADEMGSYQIYALEAKSYETASDGLGCMQYAECEL
jgi:hypothetical protein